MPESGMQRYEEKVRPLILDWTILVEQLAPNCKVDTLELADCIREVGAHCLVQHIGKTNTWNVYQKFVKHHFREELASLDGLVCLNKYRELAQEAYQAMRDRHEKYPEQWDEEWEEFAKFMKVEIGHRRVEKFHTEKLVKVIKRWIEEKVAGSDICFVEPY